MKLENTIVMSTVEKVNIFSNGEVISRVTNYRFSVVLITNDSYTNEETNRRISLSKQAMANLTKKSQKAWKFQPTQMLS